MGTVRGHILMVDDDAEMRSLVSDFFEKEGYRVSTVPLASDALERILAGESYDVVISDVKMPKLDGLSFVKKLKEAHVPAPVILITAFGSIDQAIEATRSGAFDYIVKPFKLTELQVTVDRALAFRRLDQENKILRNEIQKNWSLEDIVGKSAAMQKVYDLVRRVASATANVLIMGESGTGKELVARAIHRCGARAQGPFVAINCSAIPENLLESELFGHAKGAFTGAIQRKKGLFEEATGGTIFLDEIGDMDLMLQAKILRVLQEKKIRPVGENKDIDVDARVICATHKDLKAMIKSGQFRDDLFYRLSVIPITIPSLRERKEDIPLLAGHFLRKYAAANGKKVEGFAKAAMEALMNQPWEGNVRELENVVERAVVLSQTHLIEPSDLPFMENVPVSSGGGGTDLTNSGARIISVGSVGQNFYDDAVSDFPTLEELEKRYISKVLSATHGRKTKASEILGINRRTLYRKEREYGFVSGDESPEMTM